MTANRSQTMLGRSLSANRLPDHSAFKSVPYQEETNYAGLLNDFDPQSGPEVHLRQETK